MSAGRPGQKPDWGEWVDGPAPGYPKRPVPRNEDAAKALKKRTMTNLYNTCPHWLWGISPGGIGILLSFGVAIVVSSLTRPPAQTV